MKNYDGFVTISTEEYTELIKAKEVVKDLLDSCMAFEISGGEICTRFSFDATVLDVMFPREYKDAQQKAKHEFEFLKKRHSEEKENV